MHWVCPIVNVYSGEDPQDNFEDLETNEAQPAKSVNLSQHLIAAIRTHVGTHYTKELPGHDSPFELDSIAQSANSTGLYLNLVAVSQK